MLEYIVQQEISKLDNLHALEKDYQDSCKMLAAAVINKQFRQQLLNNPEKAITSGFGGQQFKIGKDASQKISTIKAENLSDFAVQLTKTLTPSTNMLSSAVGGD